MSAVLPINSISPYFTRSEGAEVSWKVLNSRLELTSPYNVGPQNPGEFSTRCSGDLNRSFNKCPGAIHGFRGSRETKARDQVEQKKVVNLLNC